MLFFEGMASDIASEQEALTRQEFAKEAIKLGAFDASVDFNTNAHIERLKSIEGDMSFALKKAQLSSFIPESIHYLSAADKLYWQTLLSEIFEGQLYLYHYHKITSRNQYLKEDLKLLNQLKDYLSRLNSPSDDLPQQALSSPQTIGASLLADSVRSIQAELCYCPSVRLRKWLSELNWYRLYWIWMGGGGGLMSSLLDMTHQSQASHRLDTPGAELSVISYSLYFTRLTFNLLLMFKHFVPGSWMSPEEKKLMPPLERLQREWHSRKFVIINDLVWGAINLATANWLVSGFTEHAKLMGAWGGILNVALMSVDIAVSIWQLKEEKNKYQKEKESLSEQRKLIVAQIQQSTEPEALIRRKELLTEQLKTLEMNWQYRQNTLVVARNIALAFVPAMILICAPLFPPLIPILALSQVAMQSMVISGGVLATGLTMFQSWHGHQNEINKINEELDQLAEKEVLVINEHQRLLTKSDRSPDDEKRLKLLMLQHKKIKRDVSYKQDLIAHKRASEVFSLASQVIFPAILMGALFTPPPVAAAIIVSAIILLVVMKIALNRHYKPAMVDNEEITLDPSEETNNIEPVLPKRLEPKLSSWSSLFKAKPKAGDMEMPGSTDSDPTPQK